MTGLTRWVLRHKLIVTAFWLAVAVAGAASTAAATHRMANSFSLPGAGVQTNAKIVAIYRNGGGQSPLIPVVTVPAGADMLAPLAAARAARVLNAARVSPAVRLVDYQTTGDPVFRTTDGRSEYALAFTPPDGSNGDALAGAMTAAMRAAAPAGWRVGLTGNGLLMTAQQQKKGTGVLAATTLGASGALVVLLFVFASLLAILPLIIAAVSVLATFLLVLGLTAVTSVSQIVTFLIALIGLGVALDYSLLVVTRWREERARLAGGQAGRHRPTRADNYAAISDSASTAAPGPARAAYGTLAQGGVPGGVLSPMEVLVRGDTSAATAVATQASRVPGVAAAFAPGIHQQGTALVTVIPDAAAGSPAGLASVAQVRTALHNDTQVIGVGGEGPALADFNHAVYGNFPLMLALIGLATFL